MHLPISPSNDELLDLLDAEGYEDITCEEFMRQLIRNLLQTDTQQIVGLHMVSHAIKRGIRSLCEEIAEVRRSAVATISLSEGRLASRLGRIGRQVQQLELGLLYGGGDSAGSNG